MNRERSCGGSGRRVGAVGSDRRRSVRRRVWRYVLISASILPVAGGCSVGDLQTGDRFEHGLVLVLPGMEGRGRLNINIARGLEEGGVESAIEIFDWGTSIPGGMLINLADHDRNLRAAQEVKDRIMRYRRSHPGRPIQLIGHSAGGGMAIMATEALPRDVQLTSVILLAPALSPEYDLCRALRRTRYGVFSYYSKHDRVYLVLGTSVFGTVDRRHGPSAGAVGFRRPERAGSDAATLYTKLHQVRWQSEMRRYGHWGGHTGWADRRFVRRYVAPLIRDLGSESHPSGMEGEPSIGVFGR